MASDLPSIPGETRLSSQDKLLAEIRRKHPEYHPVVAMVDIAMDERIKDELGLQFMCHKEVARYTVAIDKAVEVKAEVNKVKRVVVELFGYPQLPNGAAGGGESAPMQLEDVQDAIVKQAVEQVVQDEILGESMGVFDAPADDPSTVAEDDSGSGEQDAPISSRLSVFE